MKEPQARSHPFLLGEREGGEGTPSLSQEGEGKEGKKKRLT